MTLMPSRQREALKKLVGSSLELRLSDMGSSAGRRVFWGEKWRLEHMSMAQTVCDTGGRRCLRCTGGEMHPHEV